jgi:double-stranded uracil-DNA glycosylase
MPDEPRASPVTKHSFPPIVAASSRVLILGTMPGDESLRQQQYYAHPRNQFWRILAEIYHVPFPETYPEREALVLQKQLALWDVVQHCEREGSLDQAIRKAVPNDFQRLFTHYPTLRAIIFNGQKAHDLFEHKVVKQQLLDGAEHLPRLLMPSTSPAATLPISAKIERWRQISAWIVEK